MKQIYIQLKIMKGIHFRQFSFLLILLIPVTVHAFHAIFVLSLSVSYHDASCMQQCPCVQGKRYDICLLLSKFIIYASCPVTFFKEQIPIVDFTFQHFVNVVVSTESDVTCYSSVSQRIDVCFQENGAHHFIKLWSQLAT